MALSTSPISHVRILSFDTGTANTGYSVLDGDVPSRSIRLFSSGMIRTKKTSEGPSDVRARIDYIGEQFKALVKQFKPSHVVCEDFTEQGKYVGKTYKEMAWMTEHFRLLGREMGYDVIIYENGYWKKKTLGAARASKKQVDHYVRHKLAGMLPDKMSVHIIDSIGIGLCLWKEILDRGNER